jgi:hypothetical protein
VIALAGNLDIFGAGVFADLTAVGIAGARRASAWNVGAFFLLVRRHRDSPF